MKKINKHNPILNGDPIKDENVYPIKKPSDRLRFKKYWLYNHKMKTGRRNWMLFRLGIVTGLRASDLVRLKWNQIYDSNNHPRKRIYYERDQKTGKINNTLSIQPINEDLAAYARYITNNVDAKPFYMFFGISNHKKHITPHTLYFIMRDAGDALGLEHIGTHSIRKTFGYIAYSQTHNIGYVMKRLNHSRPHTTLRYIGIERETMDHITNSINWN